MKEHISWTIGQLESWRDTFDNEGDEKAWEEVNSLMNKLRLGKCSRKDYENVLFHLWQQHGQDEV